MDIAGFEIGKAGLEALSQRSEFANRNRDPAFVLTLKNRQPMAIPDTDSDSDSEL